jgi:tyrosyl-tRNA synthetase
MFPSSIIKRYLGKRYHGSLVRILKERGLIEQHSHPLEQISDRISGIYWGFDPTGPSFHLGHLMGIMTLAWASRYCNIPCIAIVGNATVAIGGDPSLRKHERQQISELKQKEFSDRLVLQLEEQLFPNLGLSMSKNNGEYRDLSLRIMSNKTWYESMSILEFFRDVGRYARLSTMLQRDSVRNRLSSPNGMGYHEFSYSLLQAFDFYILNHRYGVNMQVGGSDQWGNMMAGLELIDKKRQESNDSADEKAFVITNPLLLNKNGSKLGKSDHGSGTSGTIWLSPALTSPYELYQFLYNTPDDSVQDLLYKFSFCSIEEISEIVRQHSLNPESFIAQRFLAENVTRNIHGEKGLLQAQYATKLVFSGKSTILDNRIDKDMKVSDQWIYAFQGTNRIFDLKSNEFLNSPPLDQFLVNQGLYDSLHLSKQAIQSGAVSILQAHNHQHSTNVLRVKDPKYLLTRDILIDDKILVLFTAGKHQPLVINVI